MRTPGEPVGAGQISQRGAVLLVERNPGEKGLTTRELSSLGRSRGLLTVLLLFLSKPPSSRVR